MEEVSLRSSLEALRTEERRLNAVVLEQQASQADDTNERVKEVTERVDQAQGDLAVLLERERTATTKLATREAEAEPRGKARNMTNDYDYAGRCFFIMTNGQIVGSA